MDKESSKVILSQRLAAKFCGQRLDRVVRLLRPDWSRSLVQRLHREGRILLDGRAVRAAQRVRGDELLEVRPAVLALLPAPTLDVLYEDASLLAVDKPAGIPTHPLRPGETGTVLDGMARLCPAVLFFEEQSAGPKVKAADKMTLQARQRQLEGGLVHRLDNDTSGVLLAAKSPHAWQALRTALANPAAYKEYLAIVCGNLEQESDITLPLAHARGDARRSVAVFPAGWRIPTGAARVRGNFRGRPRPALSQVAPIEGVDGYTLVRIRVHTALTHQVRVHLAALGHPLMGDQRYLPASWPVSGPRLALHASRIVFFHPESGAKLQLHAPWAPDLLQAWEKMGGRFSD